MTIAKENIFLLNRGKTSDTDKQKVNHIIFKFKEFFGFLKRFKYKKEHLQDFYKKSVTKKNKKNMQKFLNTSFSERIILLPQCLRNIEKCKAHEIGYKYECKECGACKIAQIIKKAKSLGYQGIYILKGGRAISNIIGQNHPKAIIGIACYYEGLIGIKECEKEGLSVQFYPLTKDGCVNTYIDLAELEKLISS